MHFQQLTSLLHGDHDLQLNQETVQRNGINSSYKIYIKFII